MEKTSGSGLRASLNGIALNGDDERPLHHRDMDAEIEVDDAEDDAIDAQYAEGAPLRFRFSWRKLWKFSGPGWLMSLAYLDPGNLESSLQLGAYTQYQLVWVLWWATVMGLILQEMSARIGLVANVDLAQAVRAEYPRWLNYVIYVMMEIAVIGADIQEVVGSGIALNLLFGFPVWVGCLITGFDTFTFLVVQYAGVRYLEAMICLLIGTMAICFFINWGKSGADIGLTMAGWIVPSLPSYALMQAVGTVGAVIMPHNLYLHSGLVLSRKIKRESPNRVYAAIWYSRIEAAVALLFSFFINLAIIAANAEPFYNQQCAELDGGPFACLRRGDSGVPGDSGSNQCEDWLHHHKQTPVPDAGLTSCVLHSGEPGGICDEIGLQVEGKAMQGALGKSALYIWAIGLLAAGQSSTMVCTYAGQIIMGGCLQIEMAPWKRVAITRVFALGPALLVALTTVENTKLFNNVNEYLNILQSVQLPFAMLPVLHFAGSKRLLGRFASGPILYAVTLLLAGLVMVINVVLIFQFLQEPPIEGPIDMDGCDTWPPLPNSTCQCTVNNTNPTETVELPGYGWALAGMYGVGYFVVCGCMMKEELLCLARFLLRRESAVPAEISSTEPLAVVPAPGQPSSQNGQSVGGV